MIIIQVFGTNHMSEIIIAIFLVVCLSFIYAIIRTCVSPDDKLEALREFNLERQMMMLRRRADRRRTL